VDVTIGGKTATISVTTTNTDGTTKTNKEILDSISTSINNMLGTESDSAVYQVDNNGNVQLSLKSAQTGYDQRIQFSNATGVLANVTGSITHQMTNLNNLDAQFTVDGITFTRGQNIVSDAISGMTFTLKNSTTGQEQIDVTQDVDKATGNINDFMKKFNDMNTQIRQQTFLNGKTGNKGPLQGMHSIRDLTLNLRQIALTDMGSAASGAYKNLTEIGIGFEKDGTMKVTDSQLLQNALTQNPDQVKALFVNTDSPVMQMYNQAKAFTDVGGTISTLKDGLDQNIKYLDNRIQAQTKYLAQYEKNLKAKFDKMYQVQLQAQSQYNTIMSMASALDSTSSSTSTSSS